MTYNGPIEVGMGFIWEPKLPHAREAIVVAEFISVDDRRKNGNPHEYQGRVKTFSRMAIGNPSQSCDVNHPNGHWNSEGHFRDAVVRCEALDQ